VPREFTESVGRAAVAERARRCRVREAPWEWALPFDREPGFPPGCRCSRRWQPMSLAHSNPWPTPSCLRVVRLDHPRDRWRVDDRLFLNGESRAPRYPLLRGKFGFRKDDLLHWL